MMSRNVNHFLSSQLNLKNCRSWCKIAKLQMISCKFRAFVPCRCMQVLFWPQLPLHLYHKINRIEYDFHEVCFIHMTTIICRYWHRALFTFMSPCVSIRIRYDTIDKFRIVVPLSRNPSYVVPEKNQNIPSKPQIIGKTSTSKKSSKKPIFPPTWE